MYSLNHLSIDIPRNRNTSRRHQDGRGALDVQARSRRGRGFRRASERASVSTDGRHSLGFRRRPARPAFQRQLTAARMASGPVWSDDREQRDSPTSPSRSRRNSVGLHFASTDHYHSQQPHVGRAVPPFPEFRETSSKGHEGTTHGSTNRPPHFMGRYIQILPLVMPLKLMTSWVTNWLAVEVFAARARSALVALVDGDDGGVVVKGVRASAGDHFSIPGPFSLVLVTITTSRKWKMSPGSNSATLATGATQTKMAKVAVTP